MPFPERCFQVTGLWQTICPGEDSVLLCPQKVGTRHREAPDRDTYSQLPDHLSNFHEHMCDDEWMSLGSHVILEIIFQYPKVEMLKVRKETC